MSNDKVLNMSLTDPPTAAPGLPPPRRPRRNKPGESNGNAGTATDAGPTAPEPIPWHQFVNTAEPAAISRRFSSEAKDILTAHSAALANYCCIVLFDPVGDIGPYDLDRIYHALRQQNPTRDKDVLLFLLSAGGSIEPAYQISKLCKAYSKERFIVVVPRQAKSAATLLAIGADEIHMGMLGQLGPIDPQLSGLPALGVSQALESVAALAQKFPGSSEMFARYLRLALTVEQIGYCERISVSAAQYAERLLSTKPSLRGKEAQIAKELVYEYKDHGFVIDKEEAQMHLGSAWILCDTTEVSIAEQVYRLFDEVNLCLGILRNKRLLVLGALDSDVLVFDRPRK